MQTLANAGQTSNRRYVELSYLVQDAEEEAEQRDFKVLAKTAAPLDPHYLYAAIGTATSFKQKSIKKMFPYSLKQCKENTQLLKAMNSTSATAAVSSNPLNPSESEVNITSAKTLSPIPSLK